MTYEQHLNITLVHPDAKIPVYATPGASAFDLFSIEDGIVSEARPKTFDTGLKVEVPENAVLLLFSRSGHGFKMNTRLGNAVGVIDSDYRGNLMINLIKDTPGEMIVSKGDRIAQGILFPIIPKVQFHLCDHLSFTERDENGIGSTGC